MTHQHEVQPCLYKCSACGSTASSPSNILHSNDCEFVKQEINKNVTTLISDTLLECRRGDGMGTLATAKVIVTALQNKGWLK